jgi:hypothetical protein
LKTCVDCQRQLPDTAMHCVFCGVKQPAADAPTSPDLDSVQAKTQIARPAPQHGSPPPAAEGPPPAAHAPPIRASGFFGGAAARDGAAAAAGKAAVPNPARAAPSDPTFAAMAPAGQVAKISNPALAPEAVPAGPPASAPPGVAPPSAPTLAPASPGFAPPAAAPGVAPPQAKTVAAAAAPALGAPPQAPMPAAAPVPAAPVAPAPAAPVAPAPRPPYLASETGARANRPVEPWAGSLRALMLAFGALLIACFAAPWSLAGGADFSWDRIAAAETTHERLVPLLMAASGLVAVVLAVFPVVTAGRGLAAATVGAVAALAVAATAPDVEWRSIATALGLIALVTGLLLRSQYRSSLLARLVVTGGAAAVILPWLVPEGGVVPIGLALSVLGGDLPAGVKLAITVELLALVVAALALIAWLPAPSSAGAAALAWVVVALLPAQAILTLVLTSGAGEQLRAALHAMLISPLATAAWIALGGFGAATLIGKALESP